MFKLWECFIKLFWEIIYYIFCCKHGSGSGSGSGHCHHHIHYHPRHISNYPKDCINLLRKPSDYIVGKGFHRSGWPQVIKSLSKFDSPQGILLDDFVEQNFCYHSSPIIYTEPWVGIFHHPPFPPSFSNKNEWMSEYINSPAFLESKKHLKLAVTLTEYHKKELSKYLDCPVIALHHPIEGEYEKWSLPNWKHNHHRSLVQLGFYLRNTQLINQIPSIHAVEKMKLWTNSRSWVKEYDKKVILYWERSGGRIRYNDVKEATFLPPSVYDKLLCKNVIVMELFDASANNGVLDCIIRNTPIIINKHPAVVEYLGEAYPLYFKEPSEIPHLVKHIEEANNYLKNMDKNNLSMDCFCSKLMDAINEI